MLEAISYVVLCFVAMPLKYLGGLPIYVTVFGWVHGVLFAWFTWALVRVFHNASWPITRLVGVLVAGLLPIVPFFLHGRFARWIAEWRPNQLP